MICGQHLAHMAHWKHSTHMPHTKTVVAVMSLLHSTLGPLTPSLIGREETMLSADRPYDSSIATRVQLGSSMGTIDHSTEIHFLLTCIFDVSA